MTIEPSWSNIADKLTYGMLDAAVMLAPLALAACAGLRGPKARLVVPLSLSQGGNAIVLGHTAADDLTTSDQPVRLRLLEWLRAQPTRPRFAVVHAFSAHNLLLRYWLASGGADPDKDIETVVIPPADVVEELAAGRIAGFCAGAPWGDVADRQGAGRILIGTSVIWPFHPEKCLCISEAWAEANPNQLHHLLGAVLRAQFNCDQPSNAPAIAALLADPHGLHLPEQACRAALPGGPDLSRYASIPGRHGFRRALTRCGSWARCVDGVGWMTKPTWRHWRRQVYRADLLASAVEAEGLYSAAALPSLEGNAMLPMPDEEAFSPKSRRSR